MRHEIDNPFKVGKCSFSDLLTGNSESLKMAVLKSNRPDSIIHLHQFDAICNQHVEISIECDTSLRKVFLIVFGYDNWIDFLEQLAALEKGVQPLPDRLLVFRHTVSSIEIVQGIEKLLVRHLHPALVLVNVYRHPCSGIQGVPTLDTIVYRLLSVAKSEFGIPLFRDMIQRRQSHLQLIPSHHSLSVHFSSFFHFVFLLVFQPTVFFGASVGSALNIRSSVGASEPCSVFNVLAISRRRYPFKTTMGLKRQGTSETMRRRAALAFPDLGGLGNPRATGTAHMELTGSGRKDGQMSRL